MATATIRISAPIPDLTTSATAATGGSKPWYRRVLEVIVEARMAQAVREIERHHHIIDGLDAYRHLTPSDIELAALRGTMVDGLPLTRV